MAALTALALVLAAAAPTGTAAATVSTAAVTPLKIMTMGDSITLGDGSPLGAYRGELSRLLTEAGVAHEFIVAAEGGKGCDYWVPRAYALTDQHRPDLVLLNCGTNDGPLDGAQGAAFEAKYRALLTNLLGGGHWQTRVVPAFVTYASVGGYPYPPKAAPWLATSIPIVNDSIYRSLFVNNPHGSLRIPATVGLGDIPETYLDTGGVHPTASGHIVAGRLWYRALAPLYGWPDIAPLPCGLSGRRPGAPSPPFVPITPGCPVV